MRFSKMKAITTSLLATALCLAIGTSTYASTSIKRYSEDVFTSGRVPGDNIEEAYCVEPGDAYGLNTWIRYAVTEETDAEIEPSVGYAAYLAKKQFNTQNVSQTSLATAIQNIVWSSDQWGTDVNKEKIKTLGFRRQSGVHFAASRPGNVASGGWNEQQRVLLNRSFQYGTVYYGLLYDNENIFNVEEGDLKVLVDKIDNTYTVGPYKLSVKDKYRNGFQSTLDEYQYNPLQILYNELYKNGNPDYSEEFSFAKFKGISGMNGTNAKFIGENGEELFFPNFMPGNEQTFYIKFNPNNEGAITETGSPIINIRYMTAFRGTKATYDADSAIIGDAAGGEDATTNIDHVETGEKRNKYEIKYQDLRIKGKTIEQYTKSYINTYGDTLNWKKDGDNYVTTIEVSLDYILKDSENVEHELEFPAKITVIGKKKTTAVPVYITYKTNSTVDTMISGIVSQVNNATKSALTTNQIDKIKDKITQSLINAMKKNSSERKEEFINTSIEEIHTILNKTKLNDETKQNILNEFKTKLTSEAKKLINNVTVIIVEGDTGDAPGGYDDDTVYTTTVTSTSSWKYGKIKTVHAKAEDDEPYQLVQDENGNIGSLYAYVQKTLRKIKNVIQNAVKIHTNTVYAVIPEIIPVDEEEEKKEEERLSIQIEPSDERGKLRLKGAPINIQIGGKVWIETPSLKVAELDGRLTEGNEDTSLNDIRFAGIQVRLCEKADSKNFVDGGKVIATTITDKNGQYRFYGTDKNGVSIVNPLKDYFVSFSYNGQLYEPTFYKKDLSGGFSNAKENGDLRSTYNSYFKDIYSDPKSCIKPTIQDVGQTPNTEKSKLAYKAYAWNEKIEDKNGNFIQNGTDSENNPKALTYGDIYQKFISLASFGDDVVGEPAEEDYNKQWQRSKTYEDVLTSDIFIKYLTIENNISNDVANSIIEYIRTTLIRSNTNCDAKTYYATEDRYIARNINSSTDEYKNGNSITLGTGRNAKKYVNIYTKASDMARNVDFGLHSRRYNDLALQKDVWKARMIVNGKEHEYIYAKKAGDDTWEIKARASDILYNGGAVYNRAVKPAEYLLDAEKTYSSSVKNLQVYVTYRIMVKNSGTVNATINEIVDYYDANQYEFDSAYIGKDSQGNKLSDNVEKNDSEKALKVDSIYQKELPSVRDLTRIYFTGKNGKALDVFHSSEKQPDKYLHPSEIMFLYVTFKVKNDDNGKVKLDQNIDNGKPFVGKRNIAEINSYSTYYTQGTEIPNTLDKDNKPQSTIINNETTPAGLIDIDSAPGSLTNKDINENGDFITDKTNEVNNRLQDDTDKSPNIRLIIDSDTPGTGPGTDPGTDPGDGSNPDTRRLKGYVFEDSRNNAVGEGTNQAIIGDGINIDEQRINGVTIQLVEMVSEVDANGLATGNYLGEKVWGSYTYDKSFNATVSYDRYASGANSSKVVLSGPGILEVKPDSLTENNGEYSFKSVPPGDFYIRFIYGDTEETVLSSQSNDVTENLNKYGRNVKSYNGQDYKSTIYQAGIDQSGNYNGINGYTNYDKQNYYKVNNLKVDSTANDIIYQEPAPDKSKMYYYDLAKSAEHATSSDAKDVWEYRQSVNNWSKGADGQNLLNYRAETLASFEKLASNSDNQQEMLNDFINNTFMVAQTGIIDTEIEKGRKTTRSESLHYTIDNINLGLVERPKVAIKINKEIDNYSFVNGVIINKNVSNNQSVENLYFSKHQPHTVNKTNRLITGVNINTKENSTKTEPELLQHYADDEARDGAQVTVRYKIYVENDSEVDYTTPAFYYNGTPGNDSEISRTRVNKIIDYVSNAIVFDSDKQDSNIWQKHENTNAILFDDDVNKNLVNAIHADILKTYNTILTTDSLNGEMKPGQQFGNINLTLSKLLSKTDTNLEYNNLVEVVSTSNDVGRRCAFSIAGNQAMADQSLGNNARADIDTKVKRVIPDEIDADSSQQIVIMTSTGEENYTVAIIGTAMAIALIIAGGVLIKKSM